MDEILKNILNGKLTRDIDERGAGGLWDYAGEVIYDTNYPCDEELQAEIYYALWEMADEIIKIKGEK